MPTRVAPYRTIVATLVGIVVAPHQVVEDDVDNSQSLVVLTPAFTRPLISCCVNYTVTGIQISGGSRNLAAVDSAVRRVGIQLAPDPIPSADTLAKAERAIKPESIALGIFGAISALAALLIAIQLIGRQRRRATQD